MAALATGSDVAVPARSAPTHARSGDGNPRAREILVFEVGGRQYGLPTADVRELVRAVTITPLPNAPAVIEGVVNVRGHVLPVLNVRARFGMPDKPLEPSDHFIVASAGSRGVILRVDRATHLTLVDETSVQPAQTLGPSANYVAGVAVLAGGLVVIHDVATFLSAAEGESVDRALGATS